MSGSPTFSKSAFEPLLDKVKGKRCSSFVLSPSVEGENLSDKHPNEFRQVFRQINSDGNIDTLSYKSPRIFLRARHRHRESLDYINKLSDEMILSIFQFLPKKTLVACSKVCHRWCRLSKDDTLWNRIDLWNNKRIQASHLHRLLNRGVEVMRLARTEIKLDSIDFARVSSCRLQYLDLSMAVTHDVGVIRDLLCRCRHLKGLSLENCDLDNDYETCLAISRNGDLKFLNLALCAGVNAEGASLIARDCRKMIELNLSWTCLDQKTISLICQLLPNTLLKLSFAGCRSNTMTDESIDSLTDSCPNLIELDISDCTEITGKSLKMIAERLTSLQVISASRCYAIEPISYIHYCKHLVELNVFSTIKDESMPVLKRALKNVLVNRNLFSTIARPTVGIRRSSIWGQKTRDD